MRDPNTLRDVDAVRIDERARLLKRTHEVLDIVIKRERTESAHFARDTRCAATLSLLFTPLSGYQQHRDVCDDATDKLDKQWDHFVNADRQARVRERNA